MTDASGDPPAEPSGDGARRRVSRRELLGGLSVVGTAAVAGCQSVLPDGSGVDPRWEYDVESAWAVSPPAVVDGTVVVGAQDKAVHAVDAGSGERRLRAETGGWIESRPAVPAGTGETAPTVHAHSADGDLYGVDLDGGIQWQAEANQPEALAARAGAVVVHSPHGETATSTDTVAYRASDGEALWRHGASAHHAYSGADRAIVEVHDPTNVERHFLVALDTTDGTVAWQTDPADSTGAVGLDGDLTVLASAGEVRGVRTSDGSERWRRSLETDLGFYVNGQFGTHVYLSVDPEDEAGEDRDDERVVALDRETGERRWSERIRWRVRGLAATDDGVYVARPQERDGGGTLMRVVALDDDGTRRWETETGQGFTEEFLVAGSTLLVNLGHAVYALNTETGDQRWKHSPDSSQLRVAADEETAYVSHTNEGRVLAFPL